MDGTAAAAGDGPGGRGHPLHLHVDRGDRAGAFAYYRHKIAAEQQVEQGGVPWSILQAAQFPILFVRAFFGWGEAAAVWFLPTDFRFQPVDIASCGGWCRRWRTALPRLPDLAGPEVLTLGQIARTWLEVRGRRRPTVHLHPRTGSSAFRRGGVTSPDHPTPGMTWAEWVRQYSPAGSAGVRRLPSPIQQTDERPAREPVGVCDGARLKDHACARRARRPGNRAGTRGPETRYHPRLPLRSGGHC